MVTPSTNKKHLHIVFRKLSLDIFDNDYDRDMLEIKDFFHETFNSLGENFCHLLLGAKNKRRVSGKSRPSILIRPPLATLTNSIGQKEEYWHSEAGAQVTGFHKYFLTLHNCECESCPGPSLTVGHLPSNHSQFLSLSLLKEIPF